MVAGTVEYMTSLHRNKAQQALVVSRPHNADFVHHEQFFILRVVLCLFAVVSMIASMMMVPHAFADDATSSPTTTSSSSASSFNPSNNVVDTQNLLGNDLPKVTDAIQQTYDETGVTVRLVYVSSFNTDQKPEEWAATTLQSLNPAPNTVMLAVAANDGNLVVVVSPNSDEWLRKQSTVDQLSEAASTPLTDTSNNSAPNWTQSALDMMAAIRTAKQTSTSRSAASVSVIVLIAVLAVLVIGIIVMIVVRRRREVDSDAKAAVEAQIKHEEEVQEESDKDSADVQETFSDKQ